MGCSSSRKGSRTYRYASSSSPWNTRFLLGLWVTEVLFGICVCVFGGVCLPFKEQDHRYDDGISLAMYYVLLFMVVGIVGTNFGFVILQYLWYRGNRLHPGFMLFMECFNVMIWLAIVVLTLWTMINWAPKWQIYEAVELMYIFAAIPYAVHLWYAAAVYHRLRKNRRRSMDVEIQDRDSTAVHP